MAVALAERQVGLNHEYVQSPELGQPSVAETLRYQLYHHRDKVPAFLRSVTSLYGTEESDAAMQTFSYLERIGLRNYDERLEESGFIQREEISDDQMIQRIEEYFGDEKPKKEDITPTDISKCWRKVQVADGVMKIDYSLSDWWKSSNDPQLATFMRMWHVFNTACEDTNIRASLYVGDLREYAQDESTAHVVQALEAQGNVIERGQDADLDEAANGVLGLNSLFHPMYKTMWLAHGFAGEVNWADPMCEDWLKESHAKKYPPYITFSVGTMGENRTLASKKLRKRMNVARKQLSYENPAMQLELAKLSSGLDSDITVGWSMGSMIALKQQIEAVRQAEAILGRQLERGERISSKANPLLVEVTPAYPDSTPLANAIPADAPEDVRRKALLMSTSVKAAILGGRMKIGPAIEWVTRKLAGRYMGNDSDYRKFAAQLHGDNIIYNKGVPLQYRLIENDPGFTDDELRILFNDNFGEVIMLGDSDDICDSGLQKRSREAIEGQARRAGVEVESATMWEFSGSHDLLYKLRGLGFEMFETLSYMNNQDIRGLSNSGEFIDAMLSGQMMESHFNFIREIAVDTQTFIHNVKGRGYDSLIDSSLQTILDADVSMIGNHDFRVNYINGFIRLRRFMERHRDEMSSYFMSLDKQKVAQERAVGHVSAAA